MVARIGAQLALFAFCVGLLAGWLAGNDFQTVLTRALLVMSAALFVGQLVGWAGKVILRDHLQRAKLAIDREHLEQSTSGVAAARGPVSPPPPADADAR